MLCFHLVVENDAAMLMHINRVKMPCNTYNYSMLYYTLSDQLCSESSIRARVYQMYCRNALNAKRLFGPSSSYWLTEKVQ